MAKSKLQIIKEILEKYPPVNSKTPGVILPDETRARNKAMKKAGIFEYIDENGHRVRWAQHGSGQEGKWGNTEARNATRRLKNPYTNERGVRRDSTLRYLNKRQRGLKASTPELQKEVDAIYAEKDRLNIGKADTDPTRYTVEHRIQQQAWKDYGFPGNPHDPHNLWLTTKAEAIKKTQIEQNLRAKKYKGKYVVDFNPETRSFHIIPRSEFTIGREAIGGFEIPHAQWSSPGYNSKEVLKKLDNSNEIVDAAKLIQAQANEATLRAVGRGTKPIPFWGEGQGLVNEIEETLSKPYDINDPYTQGIWHGFDDQGDPWVKISRELNLDSGEFDDATGKFTYTKDPTARTDIDILSDIGEGKGNYGEILKLKNQFHDLKRSLPPGEYYLHADDPTKAKYYQRAFRNDPWIGPSGEKGGGRLRSKVPGQKGEYVEYDTLKLTVPEKADQFTEALAGKTPWEAQGIPRTDLSKDVMLKAKQYGLQMSDVSDLSKAMRKAGSILPFVGAGLDAWDVQQRWEEAMNNPNKGFADWLDKVQLGLATTTLGTSFWAEPANFALGMTNLGIDVARTFAEEDKREDFFRTMRAVGREGTRIARMAL